MGKGYLIRLIFWTIWIARKTLPTISLRSRFAVTECRAFLHLKTNALPPNLPPCKSGVVEMCLQSQNGWWLVDLTSSADFLSSFPVWFSYQVCICEAAEGLLSHFPLEASRVQWSALAWSAFIHLSVESLWRALCVCTAASLSCRCSGEDLSWPLCCPS